MRLDLVPKCVLSQPEVIVTGWYVLRKGDGAGARLMAFLAGPPDFGRGATTQHSPSPLSMTPDDKSQIETVLTDGWRPVDSPFQRSNASSEGSLPASSAFNDDPMMDKVRWGLWPIMLL